MKGLQKSLVIIFVTIFSVLFSVSNCWAPIKIGNEDKINFKKTIEQQFTDKVVKNFSHKNNSVYNYFSANKKSKYALDALYILGRIFFNQRKYEEAVITFVDFTSNYPMDERFQEYALYI